MHQHQKQPETETFKDWKQRYRQTDRPTDICSIKFIKITICFTKIENLVLFSDSFFSNFFFFAFDWNQVHSIISSWIYLTWFCEWQRKTIYCFCFFFYVFPSLSHCIFIAWLCGAAFTALMEIENNNLETMFSNGNSNGGLIWNITDFY